MKNKGIVSILLMFVLLLSVCPVGLFGITVGAETATSGTTGDCTWTLDGTVLTISGNGNMVDYYYDAPWGTLITEVIIKEGVASIGDCAFTWCTGLTSVTVPNSVTSIGFDAFSGCIGLKNITIPSSVTSIGSGAFRDCTGLTSITIPGGVTSIGFDTFLGCSGLTSITIPNSVTSIDIQAFYGCSSLTSITIPNNVTSIGNGAFYGCSSLTSITIPDGVTSIGNYTFYVCTGLTNVTIPYSVISIGSSAFCGCIGLKNITVPSSVTSIGYNAFGSCYSLKELTIESDEVPTRAFEDCSRLKKIFFSKNLKTVYNIAFKSATGITDVYYEGSEEEWQKVVIKANNGSLSTATVHYNRTGISNITSMSIGSKPAKLFYKLGEEIDVTGGKLAIGYDDGKWEYADITADMLTGYKSEKYGEQEITVAYKACMAKFTVETYRTGDIDGDEHIGASDIAKLRECLLSVITGNVKFDVNSDGETDIRDLVRIKKLAVG